MLKITAALVCDVCGAELKIERTNDDDRAVFDDLFAEASHRGWDVPVVGHDYCATCRASWAERQQGGG